MALSAIDQSCQTVTITDDVIQNPMSFENNNIQGQKKKKKVYFKNFQPFFSIPVEAPIFNGKLYQDDPNN